MAAVMMRSSPPRIDSHRDGGWRACRAAQKVRVIPPADAARSAAKSAIAAGEMGRL